MKTLGSSLCVALIVLMGMATYVRAAEPAKTEPLISKWIPSTAYAIPKELSPDGEGYFAIIEGLNGRLYVGTHFNAVNSWLVEFDPKDKKMTPVVDVHKAIGTDIKGFGAQAKIHTRNNTGKLTGKIYFGSKQGYPDTKKGEKGEDYPGGYPMVYDPKTGKTEVYPIPVKHHGINSIMPDESRGLIYISTCSDHRPGPEEGSIFLILDTKTGKYQELIDTEHSYGFIVLDDKGRAYHPMRGGKIARYDPETKKLDLLKQTIDGKPPTPESHLADEHGHPINWDATPDGKTLYCIPMSTNQLYSYDLTAAGDTIPGKSLGTLVADADRTDCRALCVGPKGRVCASVTASGKKVGNGVQHLITYRAGDKAPRDHGVIEVSNPDYTPFKDKNGNLMPWHGGFYQLEGHMTSKEVTLGICEAADGAIYILCLHPYTLLQVKPDKL